MTPLKLSAQLFLLVDNFTATTSIAFALSVYNRAQSNGVAFSPVAGWYVCRFSSAVGLGLAIHLPPRGNHRNAFWQRVSLYGIRHLFLR